MDGPGTSDTERTQMANRVTSFEYEDLLACARGELFGPGNAQLPLPPMLMFERISRIQARAASTAKARSWRS